MSLISYVDEMLGADLKEIGFTRKKGTEWFKIIDDCIYLNVFVRRVAGGFVEIYCKTRSLFSPLIDSFLVMNHVNVCFSMSERQNGRSGIALHYDETPEVRNIMMNNGRKIFGIVKPILGEVSDLKSCFEANEILYSLRLTGRAAMNEEISSWPPEDGYYILCRQGLYEEAGEYMRNAVENYGRHYYRTTINKAEAAALYEQTKNRYAHYIRLDEEKDYKTIIDNMRNNYIDACDKLNNKYRIRIEQDKHLSELEKALLALE